MHNGCKGDVLKITHIHHLTISMGREAVHSLAAIKVLAGLWSHLKAQLSKDLLPSSPVCVEVQIESLRVMLARGHPSIPHLMSQHGCLQSREALSKTNITMGVESQKCHAVTRGYSSS